MNQSRHKDPLHGVTLEMIVTRLAQHFGWSGLARRIEIRCFMFEPSVTSSLKFLRRTPWARQKVEALYAQNAHKLAQPAPSEPPTPRA